LLDAIFSIGPLISRKQAAHNAADLDGSGEVETLK
jgi:hypothetical protein